MDQLLNIFSSTQFKKKHCWVSYCWYILCTKIPKLNLSQCLKFRAKKCLNCICTFYWWFLAHKLDENVWNVHTRRATRRRLKAYITSSFKNQGTLPCSMELLWARCIIISMHVLPCKNEHTFIQTWPVVRYIEADQQNTLRYSVDISSIFAGSSFYASERPRVY